jgi:hypothetical protein
MEFLGVDIGVSTIKYVRVDLGEETTIGVFCKLGNASDLICKTSGTPNKRLR